LARANRRDPRIIAENGEKKTLPLMRADQETGSDSYDGGAEKSQSRNTGEGASTDASKNRACWGLLSKNSRRKRHRQVPAPQRPEPRSERRQSTCATEFSTAQPRAAAVQELRRNVIGKSACAIKDQGQDQG